MALDVVDGQQAQGGHQFALLGVTEQRYSTGFSSGA
jgi:hypothetical protein